MALFTMTNAKPATKRLAEMCAGDAKSLHLICMLTKTILKGAPVVAVILLAESISQARSAAACFNEYLEG